MKKILPVLLPVIIGVILIIAFIRCCRYGHCCGKNQPAPTPAPSQPNQPQTIVTPSQVRCNSDMIGYDVNGNRNSACGKSPCSELKGGYDIYGKLNPDCVPHTR